LSAWKARLEPYGAFLKTLTAKLGKLLTFLKTRYREAYLRILHTSDWHLGRYLHKTRQRYEEFEKFLDFLAGQIEARKVDCLIVAGDVFDTTTPSNRAQRLYYEFIQRIVNQERPPRVVIIAGNHDSPTFLEAPAGLLEGFGVHIAGTPCLEKELITLSGPSGRPELLVCAVPYLREGDLRAAVYEETSEEARKTLASALAARYREAREAADRRLSELGADLPVVAVGHLFIAGSVAEEGDGVREIHAGPLEAMAASSLPPFDYVALGHLHGPQKAGKSDFVRYSGSPLPMSFGEAGRKKSMCQVDLEPGREPVLELVEIPIFQKLARIEGDAGALMSGMRKLEGTGAWLELIQSEGAAGGDQKEALEAEAARLGLEIIRIRDTRFRAMALAAEEPGPDLAALSPEAVFESLLTQAKTAQEDKAELRETYARVLTRLLEEDQMAQ
jgi:exonuclease SbcD